MSVCTRDDTSVDTAVTAVCTVCTGSNTWSDLS